MFRQPGAGMESFVVGAVGALQFDVLEHRLRAEYGVELRQAPMPHRHARWIAGGYDAGAGASAGAGTGAGGGGGIGGGIGAGSLRLNLTSSSLIVLGKNGQPAILFENEWSITWALEKNKGLSLKDVSWAGGLPLMSK
jgi:peptide chain release factor 3